MNVSNVNVLYDVSIYDHFPISFDLCINSCSNILSNATKQCLIRKFVDWNHFSTTDSEKYEHNVTNLFSSINLCYDIKCNVDHAAHIDGVYDMLVKAFHDATNEFTITKAKVFRPVPGWNDFCKDKYKAAREAFLVWLNHGKIRSGALYDTMRYTRKVFVNALKYCRHHENDIRNNKLAESMRSKNMLKFWKTVRNQANNLQSAANIIDGKNNNVEIANVFYDKFSSISGKSTDSNFQSTGKRKNYGTISNLKHSQLFSVSQISDAISQINTGIGIDGIHSNHLKYLPLIGIKLLVKFFNSCIIHNHLPVAMLEGYIKPLVKDKKGDINRSDNYREVMISNNLFKLFEYALLPKLKRRIDLSPYQFGYRHATSTVMAVGLLKETINKYISEGSPVYACFLDLSKAFERLTHDKLLDKLKEKSVPSYIINLINIMFLNSFVSVKYDDAISKKWNLKRGVRQGGVLSAFLFCVYIDDILTSISQLGVGCKLGINVMNVQAYADDIVLMAPSASGLQKILNRAGNLIAECDLVVNIKKTEVMVFKRKAANLDTSLKFYLYDRPINFVESFKYLGCFLSTNLNDFNDIDRCSKSFNRSAGILLRKFCYTDPDILFFLFNSYCTSFYGSELWTMKSGCNTILKEFSIAYHAILKKILKIPKYFSNHYTCLKLNTLCVIANDCKMYINKIIT